MGDTSGVLEGLGGSISTVLAGCSIGGPVTEPSFVPDCYRFFLAQFWHRSR